MDYNLLKMNVASLYTTGISVNNWFIDVTCWCDYGDPGTNDFFTQKI